MIPFFSYLIACIGAFSLLLYGECSTNQTFISLQSPHITPMADHTPFSQYPPKALLFSISPHPVSIPDLLRKNQDYHQQVVSIRGLITQPELHLDETELFLDFVFRLSQDDHSIIVYGRHDRTLGSPVIRMNESVEVVGIFFREQERNGSLIFNVLEAISVQPYPSSIPEST